MNWRKLSDFRIESPEGYLIMISRINEKKVAYIARAPRRSPIIYCGYDEAEAKAACDQDLQDQGAGH